MTQKRDVQISKFVNSTQLNVNLRTQVKHLIAGLEKT